jgi:hypothetical protein
MIRHLVMITAAPQIGSAGREALLAGIEDLLASSGSPRTTITADLGLRPGVPQAADWLLTLDFATVDDFFAYLESPSHKQFRDDHSVRIAGLTACQIPS